LVRAPGRAPARALAAVPAEAHRQVLVVADFPQVLGDELGERNLVQLVVLAGREPGLDRGGGLLGQLGEHVVGAQQGQGGRHDLAAGQLLGGQRPVVRQFYPRHRCLIRGRARDVEGELEQPGRGEPQRELSPERVHLRPVGVPPCGQGLLVLVRLARRRHEHPHQQLARRDRRVVAVLQQLGPLHRANQETLPQLVIDDPFDLVKLAPLHDGLHPR
jgi:hypothetical protein